MEAPGPVDRKRRKQDRLEAREWARALLARRDWVILDTETTGLGDDAEVIQIAVLAPRGATLLDALLRPTTPIPPAATAVHGIDTAMTEPAVTYAQIHDVLAYVLSNKVVIAYNAGYDARLLRQTAHRHGIPPLDLTWECAMKQYARFAGRWSRRRHDYAWQRLPLSKRYKGRPHQAIADCWATLELLERMAAAPPWWQFWRT